MYNSDVGDHHAAHCLLLHLGAIKLLCHFWFLLFPWWVYWYANMNTSDKKSVYSLWYVNQMYMGQKWGFLLLSLKTSYVRVGPGTFKRITNSTYFFVLTINIQCFLKQQPCSPFLLDTCVWATEIRLNYCTCNCKISVYRQKGEFLKKSMNDIMIWKGIYAKISEIFLFWFFCLNKLHQLSAIDTNVAS